MSTLFAPNPAIWYTLSWSHGNPLRSDTLYLENSTASPIYLSPLNTSVPQDVLSHHWHFIPDPKASPSNTQSANESIPCLLRRRAIDPKTCLNINRTDLCPGGTKGVPLGPTAGSMACRPLLSPCGTDSVGWKVFQAQEEADGNGGGDFYTGNELVDKRLLVHVMETVPGKDSWIDFASKETANEVNLRWRAQEVGIVTEEEWLELPAQLIPHASSVSGAGQNTSSEPSSDLAHSGISLKVAIGSGVAVGLGIVLIFLVVACALSPILRQHSKDWVRNKIKGSRIEDDKTVDDRRAELPPHPIMEMAAN